MARSGSPRGTGPGVGLVAGLAAGLGAGAWAGLTLLSPVPDVLAAPGYVLATAEEGGVGQALTLNAVVTWPVEQTLGSPANGTVTTHEITGGAWAEPGDVLVTVDLQPVVLAAGTVPSFRPLARGDRGQDVAQLQELLISLGYLDVEPDAAFGVTTERAVRMWQQDLGLGTGPSASTVPPGRLVFVDSLPARIAVEDGAAVGSRIVEGVAMFRVLTAEPSVVIPLAENQVAMVPVGAEVVLHQEGSTLPAHVSRVVTATAEAPAHAVLEVDTVTLCGETCDGFSPTGETLVPATVTVVPETSGVVVPAAALVTTATGEPGVTLADGAFHPVTVVAAARGTAVVEGLDVGTAVRVPGSTP